MNKNIDALSAERALKLALEALRDYRRSDDDRVSVAMGILQEALAHAPTEREQPAPAQEYVGGRLATPFGYVQPAQQQEPVAWMPIEQMYPQGKAIDILMGDGSILCAVLPQFDGDLWWEGSGTGEKFIDPKYANVTHWRIHDERTSPPASKPRVPLTDEGIKTRTDEQIEATFKRCGGRWNGDHWVIEDADLYPFVRTIEGADLNTLRAISDEYNAWIKHHAAGHTYDDFLAKREAAHGIKEKNA